MPVVQMALQHGNSGLTDGMGQSDVWDILRGKTHLKSDRTLEKR